MSFHDKLNLSLSSHHRKSKINISDILLDPGDDDEYIFDTDNFEDTRIELLNAGHNLVSQCSLEYESCSHTANIL